MRYVERIQTISLVLSSMPNRIRQLDLSKVKSCGKGSGREKKLCPCLIQTALEASMISCVACEQTRLLFSLLELELASLQ